MRGSVCSVTRGAGPRRSRRRRTRRRDEDDRPARRKLLRAPAGALVAPVRQAYARRDRSHFENAKEERDASAVRRCRRCAAERRRSPTRDRGRSVARDRPRQERPDRLPADRRHALQDVRPLHATVHDQGRRGRSPPDHERPAGRREPCLGARRQARRDGAREGPRRARRPHGDDPSADASREPMAVVLAEWQIDRLLAKHRLPWREPLDHRRKRESPPLPRRTGTEASTPSSRPTDRRSRWSERAHCSWSTSTDSGRTPLVKPSFGAAGKLDWSPDGSKILFHDQGDTLYHDPPRRHGVDPARAGEASLLRVLLTRRHEARAARATASPTRAAISRR